MTRKFLKGAAIVVSVLFLAASFSGCDMLTGLLGGGGSGGSGGGGGGGGGGDPIAIPDSVAADPAYAAYEGDFLVKINKERSDNLKPTFASRDANLDALARRYAKVGAVDTVAANLKSRVATAIGSCSEAAFFSGGSTTLGSYVDTLMAAWLAGPGGTTTMRSTSFTKIGIGMVVGANAAILPGETWHSVVVLLAKP